MRNSRTVEIIVYRGFMGNFIRVITPRRTRGEEQVKVKVKFTLEQASKAQRGSRGIDLLFL
jgi:hypothetical protein